MEIEYRDNETRRRCEDEAYMRSKFPPNAVSNLQLLMYRLSSYPKFEAFEKLDNLRKKYRVHKMKGNQKGLISLSFSGKSRLTLKLYLQQVSDKILIWEVSSNHYGD